MVDTSGDSSLTQVKSSYDDVNSALENLLGNVGTGASNADITNLKNTVATLQTQSTSLQNQLNNFVGTNPVGTVLAFTTDTIPNGYLLCNGASFDTSKYSQLYAAIKSSSVPDLRGMFLRGLDTVGTSDSTPNRNLLSFQEGSFLATRRDGPGASGPRWDRVSSVGQIWQQNNHDVPTTGSTMLGGFGDTGPNQNSVLPANASPLNYSQDILGIARPKNVAVNYIIKAIP